MNIVNKIIAVCATASLVMSVTSFSANTPSNQTEAISNAAQNNSQQADQAASNATQNDSQQAAQNNTQNNTQNNNREIDPKTAQPVITVNKPQNFTQNTTMNSEKQSSENPSEGKGFSSDQVKEIQKIIHDYLVNNPTVLIEASESLQAQRAKEQQTQALAAIQQNKEKLFNAPASPVVGNPQGKVMLVEFFDYQCGHCKAMAPILEAIVKKDKDLKVIFKELPIFGGASRVAAEAALASEKQGKYYQFHNALFKAQGPLNRQTVLQIAKKVGLNIPRLTKDMRSKAIKQELSDNFLLAQSIKLVGTPTFVISDQKKNKFKFIPGAASQDELQQQMNDLK